jgi:hypothetical protein
MQKLVMIMVVLGSTIAAADTMEEKRIKADAEKLVAFSVKQMNKACKTTIPDTDVIDWASWKTLKDETSAKVSSQCGNVAYGIDQLCHSDKIAQETVAKDIKKLTCMGDTTEDIKLELKGDTLVFHTRLGVKDTDKKTKTWLSKNLQ